MPDVSEARPAAALRRGELAAAASALLLLFSMFALKWFGVDGIPGRAGTHTKLSTSIDAWQGLAVLRWLLLLTIAAAVGSVLLHISQRSHGAKTSTGPTVTTLATLTAMLLTYRVLIELPAPDRVVDQKLGALLGLFSAIGIALCGHRCWRDERGLEHRSSTSNPGGVRGSVRTRASRRRFGGGREDISNQYVSQP